MLLCVGTVLQARETAIVKWEADRVYTSGQLVTFENNNYLARYWTRGQQPGKAFVWKVVNQLENPAEWSKRTTYIGGDVVTWQNKKYVARYWTRWLRPDRSRFWGPWVYINTPPVANAGDDQTVLSLDQVTLEGVAEDDKPKGMLLQWKQVSGETVTLTDADSATATFTAPETTNGEPLVFRFTATDYLGQSHSDEVSITVVTPTVNAGPDRSGIVAADFEHARTEEILFLIGSGTSNLKYQWKVVQQPEGSQVRFTSDQTPVTGFIADTAGTYELSLFIGDHFNDQVTVTMIEDLDGDGLANADDLDIDGDGFLNNQDAFPENRVSHLDNNSDGIGNYYEDDVDQDGVPDHLDELPLDANFTKTPVYVESKEVSPFNQNDGTNLAEKAGTLPKIVNGKVHSQGGAPDLDYYELQWQAGTYTLLINGANPAMNLTATVIDVLGNQLPSMINSTISQPNQQVLTVQVEASGAYYLLVTDGNGRSDDSWGYQVTIFSDRDMDGIADDVEQAIDSNHLTADSDGDGISDFIEINLALNNWDTLRDGDGDNIPLWWDLDSDNDRIPDSVEYRSNRKDPAMNDQDGDGQPNFVDLDSDGNEFAPDELEAGVNPLRPTDTDLDGVPDYLDLDNDNDGLPDTQETLDTYNKPLQHGPGSGQGVEDTLRILSIQNRDLGIEKTCRAGDTLLVTGANFPADRESFRAIMKTLDGAITLTPVEVVEEQVSFICPDNVQPGIVEFYLVTAEERSDGVAVQFLAALAPQLNKATFNSKENSATLVGNNLKQELTITFEGAASVSIDNRSGNADSVVVSVPDKAVRGYVTVSSPSGISNRVWLQITRMLNGLIESPNSSVDVTKLEVLANLTEVTWPEQDGTFTVNMTRGKAQVLSALIERSDSTGDNFQYATYLAAVALPEDSRVVLSAESTALAWIWDGVGVTTLIPAQEIAMAREELSKLPEVTAFGQLLAEELKQNPFVLSEKVPPVVEAARTAMRAGVSWLNNYLNQTAMVSMEAFMVGVPAAITPEKVDEIRVFERENTGNINIENGTRLYLSTKIIGSDGSQLQGHITGIDGMVAGQTDGLLTWNSTKPFNHPSGSNATVEVMTPGMDFSYEPFIPSAFNVWIKLYALTGIDRVIWPLWGEALPGMTGRDFTTLVYQLKPSIVETAAVKAMNNDIKGSVTTLGTGIFNEIASNSSGELAQALLKQMGDGTTERTLARLAAKLGENFELSMEDGINAAQTVSDLTETDQAVHFNVSFAPQIWEVTPNKVKPDGTSRSFTIKGAGFKPIKEGSGIFAVTKEPRIELIDEQGNNISIPPSNINQDGTEMTIDVKGWFLDKGQKGALTMKLWHPYDAPEASAIKMEAITFVNDVSLSSITPEKGIVGINATVIGSGFATTNLLDNEVHVGGIKASILTVSENSITFVIPSSLTPGTHNVTARARYQGAWGKTSNALLYTVEKGEVDITVCDNGSLKDDAFALYVNEVYYGTMEADPATYYCKTFNIALTPGKEHSAMLLGIKAPDAIGTYSISFSGVQSLTGDPVTGYDLVPGVKKYYRFQIAEPGSSAPMMLRSAPAFFAPMGQVEE